jgi:hypothetical protein
MKTEVFNDEPLSDGELFVMLRESFSDSESCWEAVREAQQAYSDLNKRLILLEIQEEREIVKLYKPGDLYAA